MESYLTNRYYVHFGLRRVDNIVIQYIVVGINKQGIFARRPNENRRGRQIFNMEDAVVVERQFSRV